MLQQVTFGPNDLVIKPKVILLMFCFMTRVCAVCLCSKILCYSSPYHDAAPTKVQNLSDAIMSMLFIWTPLHPDPVFMLFHHKYALVWDHDRLLLAPQPSEMKLPTEVSSECGVAEVEGIRQAGVVIHLLPSHGVKSSVKCMFF